LKVDPSTFEIIRHKFFRVIDESITALMNVSGSSITNEGHDVMVSLYRADGGLLMGGVGFLHHITSASHACKQILREFSEDPGINEGDAYLLNDPYSGALHTPDTYIVMPIHYKGRLVAWTANFVNIADVGAIDPGGFCPRASDIFQEGFSTPGLRLIEGGKIRRDILGTILNMVREPGMVALDIKSQIAACNVAKSRFLDVIKKYGWETVDEVSIALINQSENLLRTRLAELPDGIWRARQHMDLPDRIYTYCLMMQKKHHELIFDFAGTSEQAPIGINCTYWATYGGVFAPLFPLLCHDITWNEGITRPVEIRAPEGTVVNCRRPAPVSVATISSLKIVNNLATMVLSKILLTSPKYKGDATAVWQGTHTPVIWFGMNQFNEFVVTPVTDGFGGSGGARTFKDGVDIGGEIANVFSRWANVETHEQDTPVLYLFRRRLTNSGGAGKFRGGMAHEYAVVTHDAPFGQIGANLFTKGVRAPLSHGLSGGYPGNTAETSVYEDVGEFLKSDLPLPDVIATVKCTKKDLGWGAHTIKLDELFYVRQVGAGGYGDPLEREAQSVLSDILDGVVSVKCAHDVYGVVIDESQRRVDQDATSARRDQLKKERLKGSRITLLPGTNSLSMVEPIGLAMNEYLRVCKSSQKNNYFFQCRVCSRVICEIREKWKDYSAIRESIISNSSSIETEFVLREFFCPNCGTLFDVEVAQKGEDMLYDEIQNLA
jgi:N-methylhydantoinase B